MTDLPDKKYYTPQEVAKFYGLNLKTLYGWIAEGKVKAVRIGPGRILRIEKKVAEELPQPAA